MKYQLAPNIKMIKRENGGLLVFNPDTVKYYTLSGKSAKIIVFIKDNSTSNVKEIYNHMVKDEEINDKILKKVNNFLTELHGKGILIKTKT